MITTFENRCVLKFCVIVLRPIYDTTHKGKKQVKIYVWDLHHELVLFLQSRNFFAVYQRMILKGTSWAGPRLPWNKLYVDLIFTYVTRKKGHKENLHLKFVTVIYPVTWWFEITRYIYKRAILISNLVGTTCLSR